MYIFLYSWDGSHSTFKLSELNLSQWKTTELSPLGIWTSDEEPAKISKAAGKMGENTSGALLLVVPLSPARRCPGLENFICSGLWRSASVAASPLLRLPSGPSGNHSPSSMHRSPHSFGVLWTNLPVLRLKWCGLNSRIKLNMVWHTSKTEAFILFCLPRRSFRI